ACAEVLGLSGPPGPYTPRTGPGAAESLLASAIQDKIDQCEARIFTLLGVLHPDAEIEVIYAGYRDASAQDALRRKSNALELLDNLLDRSLKRKLLPLLDDAPRDVKLRAAAEHFALIPSDSVKALLELIRDESAWVRACAIHLAGERPDPLLVSEVRENLEHGWDVVREAAIVALEKCLPLDQLATAVTRRARDEAAFVQRRAKDILAADAAARASTG
ncbi:MAG: HEAT repeat domain-containing protein, partial [Myxococcales bacterium]